MKASVLKIYLKNRLTICNTIINFIITKIENLYMANYYTIPEFAKLKKTTRQTIYNAIAREELEYAKLYGKILIRKTGKNDSWKVNKSQQRFKK